jgi:hypothetical protein
LLVQHPAVAAEAVAFSPAALKGYRHHQARS